jgi:uncharacterized membrane protein
MEADQIRDALRGKGDDNLSRRKKLMLLSAIGLVDFSIISLYQTGVIRHLPDLPFKVFDSDGVNGAKDAYMMGVPDAPVSALTYAATMVLASAGGTQQSGRKPIADIALGATIGGNAIGAVYYLSNMIFKQKKICVYCVTGAVINIASAVVVAPLFRSAVRKMMNRS